MIFYKYFSTPQMPHLTFLFLLLALFNHSGPRPHSQLDNFSITSFPVANRFTSLVRSSVFKSLLSILSIPLAGSHFDYSGQLLTGFPASTSLFFKPTHFDHFLNHYIKALIHLEENQKNNQFVDNHFKNAHFILSSNI